MQQSSVDVKEESVVPKLKAERRRSISGSLAWQQKHGQNTASRIEVGNTMKSLVKS